MNFVTIEYLLFLVAVFVVYWHLKRTSQNLFLLGANWIFYCFWDYRFLVLVIATATIDFIVGRKIDASDDRRVRRNWLLLSLVYNLSALFYFKYCNFFIDSFVTLANTLGWPVSQPLLNIILPAGISFFTFQSLSYSFDIYRREIKPTKSYVEYAAFVSFFPHMVAGPIVRAREFLYQIEVERHFNGKMFEAGLVRFVYGMLKKALIADTLGLYVVDPIFADPSAHSPATLWLGMLAYMVQIYADFSGYTNMAIGSAMMIGFILPENFRYPYLATNISDFWRRWHMTMSRFFRDYIYISLGGNRVGEWKGYRNSFITTLVSGLWHGANWTFVVWGLMHGIFTVVYHFYTRHFGEFRRPGRLWRVLLSWLFTNFLVGVAFVVFRAPNFSIAGEYISNMFVGQGTQTVETDWLIWTCFLFVAVDHAYGWAEERKLKWVDFSQPILRGAFYAAALVFLFNFVPQESNPFIYFQF